MMRLQNPRTIFSQAKVCHPRRWETAKILDSIHMSSCDIHSKAYRTEYHVLTPLKVLVGMISCKMVGMILVNWPNPLFSPHPQKQRNAITGESSCPASRLRQRWPACSEYPRGSGSLKAICFFEKDLFANDSRFPVSGHCSSPSTIS